MSIHSPSVNLICHVLAISYIRDLVAYNITCSKIFFIVKSIVLLVLFLFLDHAVHPMKTTGPRLAVYLYWCWFIFLYGLGLLHYHRSSRTESKKKGKGTWGGAWEGSFIMPPPLGARGIMFSGCPSVRPKPEIPSFDLYMGPLFHPTNRNRFTACPSVRMSVRPSVWRDFRAFARNFTCWYILTIFRTD